MLNSGMKKGELGKVSILLSRLLRGGAATLVVRPRHDTHRPVILDILPLDGGLNPTKEGLIGSKD